MKQIIERQPLARFDRCHFARFAESSLQMETVYYVRDPDYARMMDVQQAVNLEVLRQFAAAGIRFAYPTRAIVLPADGSVQVKVPQKL